jgi:hypothetical protein
VHQQLKPRLPPLSPPPQPLQQQRLVPQEPPKQGERGDPEGATIVVWCVLAEAWWWHL